MPETLPGRCSFDKFLWVHALNGVYLDEAGWGSQQVSARGTVFDFIPFLLLNPSPDEYLVKFCRRQWANVGDKDLIGCQSPDEAPPHHPILAAQSQLDTV